MSLHKINAFTYATIIALGGFIFGLDAAVISGTVKYIAEQFSLNDWKIGIVVELSAAYFVNYLIVQASTSDAL